MLIRWYTIGVQGGQQMKKKYYYKNHLIRTSDHDYSFAVINEYASGQIIVRGCHGTFIQAIKRFSQEEKHWEISIDVLEREYKDKITRERFDALIKKYNIEIDTLKIVEIEAR